MGAGCVVAHCIYGCKLVYGIWVKMGLTLKPMFYEYDDAAYKKRF